MAAAVCSSISTACFVYKKKRTGKAKTTPSKSPRRKEISPKAHHDQSPFQRLKLFELLWNDMQQAIQMAQLSTCQEILEDVCQFVLKNVRKREKSECGEEIPTAVLMTGVNMPDHDVVFSTLKQIMMSSVTPFVVSLSSRDAQNNKSAIQKLVTSLFETAVVRDEVNLPKMKCTLPVLVSWYNSVVEKDLLHSSPVKRAKLNDHCTSPFLRTRMTPPKTSLLSPKRSRNHKAIWPVVVILEDFEKFPTAIIQEFVLICSGYVKRLPLMLVLGVSTSAFAIHQILQQSSLSKLAMETFLSQSPTEYLNRLLDEILFSDQFPFKIGSRILQLLESVFLYNDLSVKTFLSGLKLCMMEYFYTSSLSCLCCQPAELEGRIKELNSEALEALRKLMSFRKYVESRPIREQKKLLQDDQYLKTTAYNLLINLHEYHSTFIGVLRVLHVFIRDLPKNPMGRQFREVYSLCLGNDATTLKEFHDCLQLLRLLAKDELSHKLNNAFAVLKVVDHLSSETETLKNLLDSVNNLEEPVGKNGKFIQTTECGQKSSLEILQKQPCQNGKRKRNLTAFEHWREEIVEMLSVMVKTYLKPLQQLPLHEIKYFDNVNAVKRQLRGNPRNAIQNALTDPWKYLQCECCKLENAESMVSSLPDICACYKLHLECGRWINLYDWLQAFMAVVHPSALDKQSSQKITKKDTLFIARFVSTVAELQFLGFVKPTPRKTDHVTRLVW